MDYSSILREIKSVTVVSIVAIIEMKEQFVISIHQTKHSHVFVFIVFFVRQSIKEGCIKGPFLQRLIDGILIHIISEYRIFTISTADLIMNVPAKGLTATSTKVIANQDVVIINEVDLGGPKAISGTKVSHGMFS